MDQGWFPRMTIVHTAGQYRPVFRLRGHLRMYVEDTFPPILPNGP